MSISNHSICDDCWKRLRGNQVPARMKKDYRHKEVCCFCSNFTESGIYVRGDEADTYCRGQH